MSKQGLVLEKVVLLGRTFEEYVLYFALDPEALRGRSVLDVASGVSSFCAEANAQDIHATAFDLIYDSSPDEIQSRCEPDLDQVTRNIALAKTYKWDFYQSPEGMRRYRERAYRAFLADYRTQRGARYVAGNLPRLPFADGQFDIVWTSGISVRPVPFPLTRTREAWEAFVEELHQRWGGKWAAPTGLTTEAATQGTVSP